MQQDTETNDNGDKRRPLEAEGEERQGKRIKSDQDEEMGNRDEKEATTTSPAIREKDEEKERPVNETISTGEKEGAIQEGVSTNEVENGSNRNTAIVSTTREEAAVEEGNQERREEGEKMAERQDEAENQSEAEEDIADYSFPADGDASSRPTDMYLDTVSPTLYLSSI